MKSIIDPLLSEILSQKDCDKLLIFQRKLYDQKRINTKICNPAVPSTNRYKTEIAEFFDGNKNMID